MIKKFLMLVLFFVSPLSASGIRDSEAESILTQSAHLFDNLSVSLLGLSTNPSGDEYLFSFCLSEDMQWGVVATGSSQGYRLNEKNKIEVINCKKTITSGEFTKLSQLISNTDTKKTRWTVRGDRPCYKKKIDGEAIRICHTEPHSSGSGDNKSFWANPRFDSTMVSASLLVFIGIYFYVLTHSPYLKFSTCQQCRKRH